jgi:hypothetical protein
LNPRIRPDTVSTSTYSFFSSALEIRAFENAVVHAKVAALLTRNCRRVKLGNEV